MNTLGDLLDSNSRRTFVDCPGHPSQSISAAQFARTVWKTGNYFRHLGVRSGSTVAVVDDFSPEPLYALFGAALLGAQVRFGQNDDWRVLVGPTEEVTERPLLPGSTRIAYGDPPADPTVAHFGTEVWSENPAFPDDGEVARGDVALATDARTYTHGELLDAAEQAIDQIDLTDDDRVAIRAPFSSPGTIVTGVVAPTIVGATILLPGEDSTGTVAVADEDAPESRTLHPAKFR